jgi:hypothetical protein
MRCLTSHTTPCIYIYFWQFFPTTTVQQRQHGDAVGRRTFLVGRSACWSFIVCEFLVGTSVFVKRALQPLASHWLRAQYEYIEGVRALDRTSPVLPAIQLFTWHVFINLPECVLGIIRTASLTRRSRCTPSLNQLFVFDLQVLLNILSYFLLSSCKALRDPTVIRSCYRSVQARLHKEKRFPQKVRVTRYALPWRQCLCDIMRSFDSSLSIAIGVNLWWAGKSVFEWRTIGTDRLFW